MHNFITKPQIQAINVCLTKIGKQRGDTYTAGEKAELMLTYSRGRTDTTTGLYITEARQLLTDLNRLLGNTEPPGEKLRRKIIGIAHDLGWELPGGKADMKRINDFIAARGYLHKYGKKKLNDYTEKELPGLVTQFVNIKNSYLKSV